MFSHNTLQPPNGGLDPSPLRAGFRKRGGVGALGDLVAMDIANTDGDVTNNRVGDDASGLKNVRAPNASDLEYGQFAVLTRSCADDGSVEGVYHGECRAYVLKASGDIAVGDPLYGSTAGVLTADGSAGDKVIARAAVAVTAPTTKRIARVFLSGISALGVKTS